MVDACVGIDNRYTLITWNGRSDGAEEPRRRPVIRFCPLPGPACSVPCLPVRPPSLTRPCCPVLCRVVSPQPPERHLQLRRPPRAAALRADLLRRAEEAAAQLASHAAAAAAVSVRCRSAPLRPDGAGQCTGAASVPLRIGDSWYHVPTPRRCWNPS